MIQLKISKTLLACLTAGLMLSGCATTHAPEVANAAKYLNPGGRKLVTTEGKVAEEAMDTAENCEHLGDINLQRGDMTAAFVNYSKAVEMEPGRLSASYKTGRLFLLKGMTEEARGQFERVLKKDPKNVSALVAMGRAYLLDNESNKAIEYCTKALEINKSLWEAHNLIGIAYDRERKFNKAIGHYGAAILLKPDAGAVYNNLGVSYYMNGDLDKAKDAFTTALIKGEDRSRVYNNLALTFAKMWNYRAARETFEREGSEATAQNNIGYLYLRDGKNKEASVAFEKAIELSPAFYREAHDNLKTATGALQE